MESAIDALNIFIRSLPKDCRFSILSFGSSFNWMEPYAIGSSNVIMYNEASQKECLPRLEVFSADLGGTDILTPLALAQTMSSTLGNECHDKI